MTTKRTKGREKIYWAVESAKTIRSIWPTKIVANTVAENYRYSVGKWNVRLLPVHIIPLKRKKL